MTPALIAMPGNEALADALAARLGVERVAAEVRRFPDGESYVRIDGDVRQRRVGLVCTLDRPDAKLVPLLLLAGAARAEGAASVGLVAPYLAYMRQDFRFRAGESVSARHVGAWLSSQLDWLVTVEPHLHRIRHLSEVYAIPTRVVSAAAAIADWVRAQVPQPLLVGPDEESAQWAGEVARRVGAPCAVLAKTRRGDRDVAIEAAGLERWRDRTPVLVDDIASTAGTLIAAVERVREAGLAAPVCVAVHALFAPPAYDDLCAAGVARVVSCDTIAHASNGIALAGAIADGVREFVRSAPDQPEEDAP